jgi:hypothetical protein
LKELKCNHETEKEQTGNEDSNLIAKLYCNNAIITPYSRTVEEWVVFLLSVTHVDREVPPLISALDTAPCEHVGW